MNRIRAAQNRLTVDALVISDPSDLFYLTGFQVSIGRLVLYQDKSSFFVDSRYFEEAKKRAVCEVRRKEEWTAYLEGAQTVGFDSAFVTCEGFQAMEKEAPNRKWTPIPKPIKELRALKEEGEIAALRKAAQLTWRGYQHLLPLLKEGIAEEDLALEFEFFCRKNGASKLSFSPTIAFGKNSAYPHYRAGKEKLRKGQVVLFDLGAVVDGYAGDMTRFVFFGSPDPVLEKDGQIVRAAQRRAVEAIRPGIRFGSLDQIVREVLREHGVESLFTHGLSHGIGLDTHEYPTLKVGGSNGELLLEPGMVFTVEPGLYRPGIGGVRYEDTVLVTASGVENFYPE